MLNLNTIEALVPSKGCGCEVYIEEAGSYKQNSVDLSLKPMPITDAKSKITCDSAELMNNGLNSAKANTLRFIKKLDSLFNFSKIFIQF